MVIVQTTEDHTLTVRTMDARPSTVCTPPTLAARTYFPLLNSSSSLRITDDRGHRYPREEGHRVLPERNGTR